MFKRLIAYLWPQKIINVVWNHQFRHFRPFSVEETRETHQWMVEKEFCDCLPRNVEFLSSDKRDGFFEFTFKVPQAERTIIVAALLMPGADLASELAAARTAAGHALILNGLKKQWEELDETKYR